MHATNKYVLIRKRRHIQCECCKQYVPYRYGSAKFCKNCGEYIRYKVKPGIWNKVRWKYRDKTK